MMLEISGISNHRVNLCLGHNLLKTKAVSKIPEAFKSHHHEENLASGLKSLFLIDNLVTWKEQDKKSVKSVHCGRDVVSNNDDGF